jgi:hypothetical protein
MIVWLRNEEEVPEFLGVALQKHEQCNQQAGWSRNIRSPTNVGIAYIYDYLFASWGVF